MAKFSGKIGFTAEEVEISPGVFEHRIEERHYYGEVRRETLEVYSGQTVLGSSKTANTFRIVADPYAQLNFFDMVYVIWNGRYWAVRQVELDTYGTARMIVRIGDIWNGPRATPEAPPDTP